MFEEDFNENFNIKKWETPISNLPKAQYLDIWRVEKNKLKAPIIEQVKLGNWIINRKILKIGFSLEMLTGSLGHECWTTMESMIITVLEERKIWEEYDPSRHKPEYKYMLKIWMSDSPSEYFAMLDLVNRILPKYDSNNKLIKQNVLVGGLGLGLIVHLLKLRKDIDKVFVIEKDNNIIKLVKPYTKSLYPEKTVKIILGDFLKDLKTLSKLDKYKNLFDVIIADIWESNIEKEEKLLFKLTAEVMEETFPNAQHLYWLYQRRVEYNYYDTKKIYPELENELKKFKKEYFNPKKEDL